MSTLSRRQGPQETRVRQLIKDVIALLGIKTVVGDTGETWHNSDERYYNSQGGSGLLLQLKRLPEATRATSPTMRQLVATMNQWVTDYDRLFAQIDKQPLGQAGKEMRVQADSEAAATGNRHPLAGKYTAAEKLDHEEEDADSLLRSHYYYAGEIRLIVDELAPGWAHFARRYQPGTVGYCDQTKQGCFYNVQPVKPEPYPHDVMQPIYELLCGPDVDLDVIFAKPQTNLTPSQQPSNAATAQFGTSLNPTMSVGHVDGVGDGLPIRQSKAPVTRQLRLKPSD